MLVLCSYVRGFLERIKVCSQHMLNILEKYKQAVRGEGSDRGGDETVTGHRLL